jgi:hypothetical protein
MCDYAIGCAREATEVVPMAFGPVACCAPCAEFYREGRKPKRAVKLGENGEVIDVTPSELVSCDCAECKGGASR